MIAVFDAQRLSILPYGRVSQVDDGYSLIRGVRLTDGTVDFQSLEVKAPVACLLRPVIFKHRVNGSSHSILGATNRCS